MLLDGLFDAEEYVVSVVVEMIEMVVDEIIDIVVGKIVVSTIIEGGIDAAAGAGKGLAVTEIVINSGAAVIVAVTVLG